MFIPQFGAGSGNGLAQGGDTHNSAQVLLYGADGNALVMADKATAGATQNYVPVAGLDGGKIVRAARVGEYGTVRSTSETILFHDAFEGSTVNLFWTQSTSTLTIAQAGGVLTLNSAGGTGANGSALITSIRQFPKYPRQPLYARFRANVTPAGASHEIAELGFGAPSANTAIINDGAFFRWRSDGTLAAVLSYNGTEQVTQVLNNGVINTSNYYYYDIVVDDDFARFIVSDAAGVPIVDQQVSLSLTVPFTWHVSHLPTFARVYVDATGAGLAVKILLAAHTVQVLDAQMVMPWPHQSAAMMRQAIFNPTTYATTVQLNNGSAPAAITPSNAAGGNAFLCGEVLLNATAASENLLSLFDFTVPSPYTFFITDIFIGTPLNTVVAVATTATVLEFALVINASSSNLSSATGLYRVPIPNAVFTAAVAVGANALFSGSPAYYAPQTPIPCLPGTHLHTTYKVIVGTATATEVYRCNTIIGGYFM